MLPQFDDILEASKRAMEKCERQEGRIDDFLQQLMALDKAKMDLTLYRSDKRELHETLDKLSFHQDMNSNLLK